jgi:hypothetical protein
VTPGSHIVVGAIGGSITRHGDSYLYELGKLVKKLCPLAHVDVRNGARGATPSLILGLCARNVIGPEVDIAVMEFTLNGMSAAEFDVAAVSYAVQL